MILQISKIARPKTQLHITEYRIFSYKVSPHVFSQVIPLLISRARQNNWKHVNMRVFLFIPLPLKYLYLNCSEASSKTSKAYRPTSSHYKAGQMNIQPTQNSNSVKIKTVYLIKLEGFIPTMEQRTQ